MRLLSLIGRRWLLALVFSGWFMITPHANAAFQDLDDGARASGLGGAYSALGEDSLSLFYNPAGLARLRQPEVTGEYSRFYLGLTDGSDLGQFLTTGGIPTRAGTFAFGWKQFSLSNAYTERTLSLGYGGWITSRLAGGLTIKQLHQSFQTPSTVVDDNGNSQPGTPSLFSQEGSAKSAISADLGLLYRLGRFQWLGLAVRDVNAPNIALDSNDTDRVARTWRLGWAYHDIDRFSVAVEATDQNCDCGADQKTGTLALEKGWMLSESQVVLVRGAFTGGTGQLRQVSTGFGAKIDNFEVDYAFVFDMSGVAIGDTAGTHRLSVSYRFNTLHREHALMPNPPPSAAPTTASDGTPLPTPPEKKYLNVINVPLGDLETTPLDEPSETPPTPSDKK